MSEKKDKEQVLNRIKKSISLSTELSKNLARTKINEILEEEIKKRKEDKNE